MLNERQNKILERLGKNERVRVRELAKELYVSEMTVRRDLEAMERENLLKRCHGGAVKIGNYQEYPIKVRMSINSKEKKDLAEQSKKYLKDGQVIFFNSSSTCAYIIPYLKDYKNIKVITNSVHLLVLLGNHHIPCALTGGDYFEAERCLVGRSAESFLREINADIAFVSGEGVSDDGYVTDGNPDLAEISKIAIKRAKIKILLMDKSKIGNKYAYNICHIDDADEIITV